MDIRRIVHVLQDNRIEPGVGQDACLPHRRRDDGVGRLPGERRPGRGTQMHHADQPLRPARLQFPGNAHGLRLGRHHDARDRRRHPGGQGPAQHGPHRQRDKVLPA